MLSLVLVVPCYVEDECIIGSLAQYQQKITGYSAMVSNVVVSQGSIYWIYIFKDALHFFVWPGLV